MPKKCKYCDEPRSSSHMTTKHPEIAAKYREYMRESFDKEIAGSEDRKEYAPKWTLRGNRLG